MSAFKCHFPGRCLRCYLSSLMTKMTTTFVMTVAYETGVMMMNKDNCKERQHKKLTIAP